jgi:hypothetical protein
MNKMYYGPPDTTELSFLISPIPNISISRNIDYANDIIIGYKYTVDFKGYATASGLPLPSNSGQILSTNLSKILQNIEKIKGVFSYNGSTLRVIDESDNKLIVASGGILKSLSFNPSPNNWTNFASYEASIEFNELSLLNETLTSAISGVSISTNIVDINKYKIKNFTENWSFEIPDDYYNHLLSSDVGENIKINNSVINVTYNLSATGKNYYNSDSSTISKTSLKEPWVQAKEFVQNRLYTQVKGLIGGILHVADDDKIANICEENKTLGPEYISKVSGQDSAQIGYIGDSSGSNGSLSDIKDKYKVYNETISCNTSESEGTFNVVYNSILKRNKDTNTNFDADNILHTVNKTINYGINNPNNFNTTISVEGKIQGLIEGGLVTNSSGSYELPQNGRLFLSHNSKNKFSNAENFLSQIIDSGNDDLKSTFKTALGITFSGLNIEGNFQREDIFISNTLSQCETPPSPTPISFVLTKNYLEANITYSLEYSFNKNGKGDNNKFITFSSYSVEEPVSVLAEIVYPGSTYWSRDGKTIFQDINTVTARKISIVIEGRDSTLKKCSPCGVLDTDIIDGLTIPDLPSSILPDPALYIISQNQTTWNPRQGSYIVNLEYICKPGCNI